MSSAVALQLGRCHLSSEGGSDLLQWFCAVSRGLMWSEDVPKPFAGVLMPSAVSCDTLNVISALFKCPVI